MKNNLKTIILFIVILLSFPIFQRCEKYDEGPSISIRSRTDRVSSRWEVENYKVNDNDYTSLVSNYSETYSKNADYSYTWGILSGNGIWEFQNNDMEIILIGDDEQSSRTLFILKLESKAFWYYYMVGSDRHELHLVTN